MKYILTEDARKLMSKDKSLNFRPSRSTKGSSGFDLACCIEEPIIIHPDCVVKVPTGVRIWLDTQGTFEGTMDDTLLAAQLMPRSSMKGLVLTNSIGLVDDDYQGEIMLSMYNYTNENVTISPGQRVIQLIIVYTFIGDIEEVEDFGTNTSRGTGGFGSTGV